MSDCNPMDWPPRLDLGCGWDERPGYLSIDLRDWYEPDLLADVRRWHRGPASRRTVEG